MGKRLGDLYVVGKEIFVGDDSGDEPIKVWLQKLNPADHSIAIKKSNAQRAKLMGLLKKPITACPQCGVKADDAETLQSMLDTIYSTDRDILVEYLIARPLLDRSEAIRSELAAEDEWAKDEYLKGLDEAWEDLQWEPSDDDPDYLRVKTERERFIKSVEDAVIKEREYLIRQWDGIQDEELFDSVLKKQIENEADLAWFREYQLCQLWLGVRTAENHNIRYFEDRAEVGTLQSEVLDYLLEQFDAVSVDINEGKGLLAVENSSDSSTPPEN